MPETAHENATSLGLCAAFSREGGGNIAEDVYNAGISGQQHVTYAYDLLNRLTDGTSSAGFSETGISYDRMGNILALTRAGTGNGTLTYTYTNGNQLGSISGFKAGSYVYDTNGNLTTDGPRGATISYNMLNLPRTATATGVSLSYLYDAAGDKLRKISGATTTDYISGIQYKTGAATIDFIQTEEGRAINTGSANYNYEYTLTDHLGNNRVTFDATNGKVGEDDYYPYGLNVHREVNAGNNYLYNKKELQVELNEYDYGARFYDPVIARWTTIDPLAEKNRRFSTYAYGANNPIRFIDVDGMVPGDFYDPQGNKVGSDSHKDDKKKYIVSDDDAKKIHDAGGTTEVSSVSSAKLLPSNTALKQSDKVLKAEIKGGGLKEQLPSLVMNNGQVIEGQTGPPPTISEDANGNETLTAETNLPAVPNGFTDNDVEASIHPHATMDLYKNGKTFPSQADGGLDQADNRTFSRFKTNIIVGKLGAAIDADGAYVAERPVGIAIFNGNNSTPAITLTQKALEKVIGN